MSSPTAPEVTEIVAHIPDPCSVALGRPTDLSTLGLLDEVEVAPHVVRVRLVLTDPGCFFFQGIRESIKDALLERFDERPLNIEVTISEKVVWTPERMEDRNRELPKRKMRGI